MNGDPLPAALARLAAKLVKDQCPSLRAVKSVFNVWTYADFPLATLHTPFGRPPSRFYRAGPLVSRRVYFGAVAHLTIR